MSFGTLYALGQLRDNLIQNEGLNFVPYAFASRVATRQSRRKRALTPQMNSSVGLGALVGYARVSTPDQDIAMQVDALQRAGCGQIFKDVASGAHAVRPGLDKAMEYLRPADILVVWKIDRLGRSLPHLIKVVEDLRARGVGFRSLTNVGMDTTSSEGRLLFGVFAALADFERELIRERTRAALIARKARGIVGGRRNSVTPAILEKAYALMNKNGKALTVREAAAVLKVSKSALYRSIGEHSSEQDAHRA